MKLNYYELRNTKTHMLFHAPKTICSDVITTHTEMRYCCCILSPQTVYTLRQFFHLSLENDVTATLKRFLTPFFLTFILKWILMQFCPKNQEVKTRNDTPNQLILTSMSSWDKYSDLKSRQSQGNISHATWDNPDNSEELLWANRSQSGAIVKTVVNLQFFFKKPFSDNSITIFQNYLYLSGHYVFLRLCTDGPYKWSRQLLPML